MHGRNPVLGLDPADREELQMWGRPGIHMSSADHQLSQCPTKHAVFSLALFSISKEATRVGAI